MNSQLNDNQFISLAGKAPQEVISYLREKGYMVHIKYTRDAKSKEQAEERVIRIKKTSDGLEVLVGFFQTARYITGNSNGNPL